MRRSLPHISPELDRLRRASIYRSLEYCRVHGSHIHINGKDMINLGSNDYLGIPANTTVSGSTASSRLIAGNDTAYHTIEESLARHSLREASLVYPTGYMAVSGCIPVLGIRGQSILSDELNHASIIDGCRLAGATTTIYKHNDTDDLASKAAACGPNTLIITEGIFSMDGDYARLQEICEIASRYGCFVAVDDAHGDFVAGDGHGTPYMSRTHHDTYCIMGSLSKALGSLGGYVAGDLDMIELLLNTSRPFIYTSALPPAILQDIQNRLSYDATRLRQKLQHNITTLASGLEQMGLCAGPQTHIIPIMVGNEADALRFSGDLAAQGVYARAIRYPTVPKNKARIRISVSALLSNQDIQHVLAAIENVSRHYRS